MDHTPSTPMETLETACEVAGQNGLRHVYCGNVAGHSGESTYCPKCSEMLIQRMGYQIRNNRLGEEATCPACSEPIRGVWQLPAPQPGR
jgi:pyruvate formate lyase activating enzyme